jgi:hypothetical protein
MRVLACPPDSPELRLGGDDDNVPRPSRVHVAHAPDRGIACGSWRSRSARTGQGASVVEQSFDAAVI